MINSLFQVCACGYCETHNQFPVLWKLDSGLFWFEVPKNGSSSVKQKFRKRTLIADMENYKNETPYVVFRDPVDRFISLFKHYFIEHERRFEQGASLCSRLGRNIHEMSIKERLDLLITNLHNLTSDEEVHHFYPQITFLDRNIFSDFKIISIGDLSEELDVEVKNTTKKRTDVNLNNEQKQYINNIYKEDYEFFDIGNVK